MMCCSQSGSCPARSAQSLESLLLDFYILEHRFDDQIYLFEFGAVFGSCREAGSSALPRGPSDVLLGHSFQYLSDKVLARLKCFGKILDNDWDLCVSEDVDNYAPPHRAEPQHGHLVNRLGVNPLSSSPSVCLLGS